MLKLWGRLSSINVRKVVWTLQALGLPFERFELSMMPRVAVTEQIIDRALDVQGEMAGRGTHRAPSPADLVLAACAEANGLTVLHYDKDFDLIAEVTGQPVQWVAPAGSVS